MIPYNWVNLESARIRRVKFVANKYDERGDVLVEFNEGKVFRYKDVPAAKVERLVHNSSPGEYFRDQIRGYHDALPEVQE